MYLLSIDPGCKHVGYSLAECTSGVRFVSARVISCARKVDVDSIWDPAVLKLHLDTVLELIPVDLLASTTVLIERQFTQKNPFGQTGVHEVVGAIKMWLHTRGLKATMYNPTNRISYFEAKAKAAAKANAGPKATKGKSKGKGKGKGKTPELGVATPISVKTDKKKAKKTYRERKQDSIKIAADWLAAHADVPYHRELLAKLKATPMRGEPKAKNDDWAEAICQAIAYLGA